MLGKKRNGDKYMTGYLQMFHQFITSGAESMRPVFIVLLEMLLLVSGEVHQVPQQECLHHGELSSRTNVAATELFSFCFKYPARSYDLFKL